MMTPPPAAFLAALVASALSASTPTHVLVEGQTNLYRGFDNTRTRGGGRQRNSNNGLIEDVPTTVLSNSVHLPLVGLGAGNLPAHLIETVIYEGLRSTNRIRLIDTAHASRNERDVARGIVSGVKRFKESQQLKNDAADPKQKVQVHLVTKIWYTYLGYERTKIAIEEIMVDLQDAIQNNNVHLRIHLLLHWPQCYDHIAWMDCEREEQNLPDRVRQAGPPPHLDRENAWKESWRSLEDVYQSTEFPSIASIGVSNFEPPHIEYLVQSARVVPHLAQINAWNVVNNSPLLELYAQHKIHVQLYNVMNGFTHNMVDFPHAHHHLLMLANQLQIEDTDNVDVSQVILKFMLQNEYSTITRTSKLERLASNSALALERIPAMTDSQLEIASKAMTAIMNQRDMIEDVQVKVKFHAKESDLFIYWMKGDEEHQVAFVENGSSVEQSTFPNHKFKVYHAYEPDKYQTFSITSTYGETQDVHVEL